MTIRINLSRLMGEHRLKIVDLHRATGVPRAQIALMYNDKALRVDLDAVEKICRHFNCPISALLELPADANPTS